MDVDDVQILRSRWTTQDNPEGSASKRHRPSLASADQAKVAKIASMPWEAQATSVLSAAQTVNYLCSLYLFMFFQIVFTFFATDLLVA